MGSRGRFVVRALSPRPRSTVGRLATAGLGVGGLALAAQAQFCVLADPTPQPAPVFAWTELSAGPAAPDLADRAPGVAAPRPGHVLRSLLLARMLNPNACYNGEITQAQLDALIASAGSRPPGGSPFGLRFGLSGTVWTGDGQQGAFGLAKRARLTYSFPGDGVAWSVGDTLGIGFNGLNAQLVTTFGTPDTGREYIRQGLASWKRFAGIDYAEVGDSGIPQDQEERRRAEVGDVRIGGRVLTGDNSDVVLAYNYFPSDGSDMCIDLGDWPTFFSNGEAGHRRLRNVVAHEHGHGLGFRHQIPCDHTKLMEPFVTTAFDAVQFDERLGAARAYGDRYSGNHSAATARDLGPIGPGAPNNAVLERDLSLNGAAGPGNTNQDWFRSTLTTGTIVSAIVTPRGGVYNTGEQQDTACGGTDTQHDASMAGNPDVEIRDATGTTVLASSTNPPGFPENATVVLAAGTYTVRVIDAGPNNALVAQMYDLRVGLPGAAAGPYANAGISKRIGVNEFCQFIGDLNSAAGDNPITTYSWDLDGNGSLETTGARPLTVYSTPGDRAVRLRVTDAAGLSRDDTITVSVIGPAPSLSSPSPTSAFAGSTVPITINGTNLSSGTVTIGGTGVTVSGTPLISASGTQITGLSLIIAGGAVPGARTLTVTTPSGSGSTTFTVAPGPSNDACTGAVAIAPGATVTGNSTGATVDGASSCDGATPRDVYYAFTPPGSGTYRFETPTAPAFDTILSVHSACPATTANALACDDDGGGCGNGSGVTFVAQAGTNYRVRVGDFFGARGAGVITRYCPADFNLGGSVELLDIFAFLNAWFAGC